MEKRIRSAHGPLGAFLFVIALVMLAVIFVHDWSATTTK